MNTAVMNGEVERVARLNPAERMQLTWALSWPCALFSLAYDLLRIQLRLSEAQLQGIDGAFAAISFFAFSTWIVWRTVRMDFPGFHLVVVRAGAPEVERTMNYRETLSVTWLICWRTSIVCVPIWVALTLLFQRPLDSFGLPAWLFDSVAELLIFYFRLVQAALDKNYAGFSLRLAGLAP